MEIDREDGRTPNQLRPLACSRNILHRPHGSASWSQGDTKVLAAVFMDLKHERRRMRMLKRLALKSYGSLKPGRLVSINELEQSINDLRAEMGVEGTPPPASKSGDEPKTRLVPLKKEVVPQLSNA